MARRSRPIRFRGDYEYSSMDGSAHARGKKLAKVVAYWHLSITGVWLHYISLGGDYTEYELDAYLHGALTLSAYQHDVIAQAVNELIDMLPPPPRASFSSEPDFDQVEHLAPDDGSAAATD